MKHVAKSLSRRTLALVVVLVASLTTLGTGTAQASGRYGAVIVGWSGGSHGAISTELATWQHYTMASLGVPANSATYLFSQSYSTRYYCRGYMWHSTNYTGAAIAWSTNPKGSTGGGGTTFYNNDMSLAGKKYSDGSSAYKTGNSIAIYCYDIT